MTPRLDRRSQRLLRAVAFDDADERLVVVDDVLANIARLESDRVSARR